MKTYDVNKVTPRPWHRTQAAREGGYCIEGPTARNSEWLLAHVIGRTKRENAANAAHIVDCVNMHEELVAALEAVLSVRPDLAARSTPDSPIGKARAALARARGEL